MKQTTHQQANRTKRHTLLSWLPIIGILCVGAYLRLYKIPQYMTFLGDEGRDMLVVLHMIVNHKWTLLGPTASVGGFFLGPMYYYFMLPFVWAWGLDPSGAAVMVALFGIATIFVIYQMATDMFDKKTGIFAASLYAVSPLVIAYSRSSWNPNLVPFFSSLAMYLLWKSVVARKPIYVFWVGALLGIGIQMHYLFLFLFPVVVIWTLLYTPLSRWVKQIGLGIAGFLAGDGLFLAFELRHGFPNTISIYNFLRQGEDTGFVMSEFVRTVTDVIYRLFGRLLYRLPPPEQLVNVQQSYRFAWEIGTKCTIWSFVILMGLYLLRKVTFPWMLKRAKTDEPWYRAIVLIALWLVIPLALFGLYKKGIYDYYFGIFFAVPFIGLALLFRAFATSKVGRVMAVCVLAALLYLNWQGRPFVYPPNNQLGQAEMIAREALAKTGREPFNFALITGGNSDHAYRFFFERWGKAPVTIENEAIDPERKTVTDQLIVICEVSDCKPLGNSLWEVAGFGRAEIAAQWQVSFVTIYKLVHYTGKDL